MEEEGIVELSVLTTNADPAVIEEAIAEAERDLGVPSEAQVGKEMSIVPPELAVALTGFVVVVVEKFATKFVEKYGESIADWLARKLKLDKTKGEGVKKAD